jgi:predicted Rossmann fold nucleotide-binding protein DprA/Smf involved in DNA uptake
MTRVAIVGSRNYADLESVRAFVKALPPHSIVISGGASGVDCAAVEEATVRGMETVVYLPDWQRFGKAAGPIRNRKIVMCADVVVAFWDGRSLGTAHTIRIAESLGKTVVTKSPRSVNAEEAKTP